MNWSSFSSRGMVLELQCDSIRHVTSTQELLFNITFSCCINSSYIVKSNQVNLIDLFLLCKSVLILQSDREEFLSTTLYQSILCKSLLIVLWRDLSQLCDLQIQIKELLHQVGLYANLSIRSLTYFIIVQRKRGGLSDWLNRDCRYFCIEK